MSSRQVGAGRFGNGPSVYDQSQSEFDVDTRRRLDGLGPSKPQLTAEQVKQAYEEALRADETRNVTMQNADEFLVLHPEILDTNKNGDLINKMLKQMFGACAYTIEHYEAATDALLVTNSLDIDKAEVVKQQQKAADAQRKAALKGRADAAARVFNSNANYENVSLEELRARANEELQLAGVQEGANGF
jgi:hypothetical protein